MTGLAGTGDDGRECVSEACAEVEGRVSSRIAFRETSFVG